MTETVSLLLALLTAASQVLLAGLGLLLAGSRASPQLNSMWVATRDALAPASLWMAWTVAGVATAGSLYFSEAARYVPCELCWYQRIAIYPMVVLLGVAAVKRDSRIAIYAAPLAIAGAVISAYHYQLQRLPSQASEFCDPTNPCSFTWVWEFHYISIPLMALTAGILIATLVTLARADSSEEHGEQLDANQV